MSTEKTYGIKFKDKLGYALGDTGGCLTFAVIGSFLQMFYTDVLYLDSKKIMMLLIIARLWDAMNDPMWGAFVIIDYSSTIPSGASRADALP